MSREIVFYAEKGKNPETRIELYWIGAEAAQCLFEGLQELDYNQSADYISVEQVATQLRLCLDSKIKGMQKDIQRYEKLIESLRADLQVVSSVEIYGEIRERMDDCERSIDDFKADIDFYTNLKQTLITICNLEFLNTRYDGTPSEWDLYVLYSY